MKRLSYETKAMRLSPREIALGIFLTCTSGLAILAHAFFDLRMVFTTSFVVLPTTAVAVLIVLLRRRLYGRFHLFANLLLIGGASGLLATLAYDAVRPFLKLVLGFSYEPFRAIAIFGQLITGLPMDDPFARIIGWLYHFWNGISFGMIFALVWPRGGMTVGFLWAMSLQGLMIVAYPRLLQIRLDDPGFLASGIIGHTLWGIVLGKAVRQWRDNA
jgi:hypothetical protein